MSTYLEDMLHFYGWLEEHPLSVGAVALYGYLLNLRNKERQRLYASGDMIDSVVDTSKMVSVRNDQLQQKLKISCHKMLSSYTKELVDAGLIIYKRGNGKEPSKYYLFNNYG